MNKCILTVKTIGSIRGFIERHGYTVDEYKHKNWTSVKCKKMKKRGKILTTFERVTPTEFVCIALYNNKNKLKYIMYEYNQNIYKLYIDNNLLLKLFPKNREQKDLNVISNGVTYNITNSILYRMRIQKNSIIMKLVDTNFSIEVFLCNITIKSSAYEDNFTMLKLNETQHHTIRSFAHNYDNTSSLDHLIWHSTGSGKTISTLNIVQKLYTNNKIDKCFIFTPSNVMNDIKNDVKKVLRLDTNNSWPDHISINTHDALWTPRSSVYDHIIIDETVQKKIMKNVKIQIKYNNSYIGGLQYFLMDTDRNKFVSLGKNFKFMAVPYGHVLHPVDDFLNVGTITHKGSFINNSSLQEFKELLNKVKRCEKVSYTWVSYYPVDLLCIEDRITCKTKYELAKPDMEGFYGESLFKCDKRILVVIDESHRISELDSNRYKFVEYICKQPNVKGVILMSATPISKSIKDINKQINLFTNAPEKYIVDNNIDLSKLKSYISHFVVDYNIIDNFHNRRIYPKTTFHVNLLASSRKIELQKDFVLNICNHPYITKNLNGVYKCKNISFKYKTVAKHISYLLHTNPSKRVAVYCSQVEKGLFPFLYMICEYFESYDNLNIDLISIYTGCNTNYRNHHTNEFNTLKRRLFIFSDAGAQGMNLKLTDELHIIGMHTSILTTTHQALGRVRRPYSHWGDKRGGIPMDVLDIYMWLESYVAKDIIPCKLVCNFQTSYPVIDLKTVHYNSKPSIKKCDLTNYIDAINVWCKIKEHESTI